jgi:prevent-host-death family protein
LREDGVFKVSATEVQKNFGAYHDRALQEPVHVTKYSRETVVILSAAAFEQLKRASRRSLTPRDLTPAQMAAIERAEIPAEHRYEVKDLK